MTTRGKRSFSDVATLLSCCVSLAFFRSSRRCGTGRTATDSHRGLPCFFVLAHPPHPHPEGLGALRGAGLARGWGLGALGAHAGGAHYAIICISYLGDVTVTSSAKTGSCPKQEPLFRRVSWWTSEFLGRQVTQHRSRNGFSVFCYRHTCVIVVTCALFRRHRRR